jgi:porin
MRFWMLALLIVLASLGAVCAQEDKKTDDLKPADPDTGESTVEERTLGLLPNPFEKKAFKFAVTYIGEASATPVEVRREVRFTRTVLTSRSTWTLKSLQG